MLNKTRLYSMVRENCEGEWGGVVFSYFFVDRPGTYHPIEHFFANSRKSTDNFNSLITVI